MKKTILALTLAAAFTVAARAESYNPAESQTLSLSSVAPNAAQSYNLGGAQTETAFTARAVGGPRTEVTVVPPTPEPSTWAMMFGGVALLVGLQRLRQRRLA